MIILFKQIDTKSKSLISWCKHTEKQITFLPDKKSGQPFAMLINKKEGIKVSGIGSILTTFGCPEESDLLFWLNGLQEPLNASQKSQLMTKVNTTEEICLSNLLISNFLKDYAEIDQLKLDLGKLLAINEKGLQTVANLEKIMNMPDKPKKGAKKQKKAKKPVEQKQKPKENKKHNKKAKEQVDPAYLKQLSEAKLERWNKGVELETSKDRRNILITSALPYVNNEPHLGNLIGAVLSADVFARYCRLRGYNTIYMCGTDEYGTATEIKALQENTTPQNICDKYHKLHAEIYDTVAIDFDFFGRTSTEKHSDIVQDMYKNCNSNEYIFEQTVDQTYCVKCDRFLADRYILATCPHCASEAKGDQCDSCGKTLEVNELIDPKCVLCKGSVEQRDSKHLFLDMIKIKPELEEFVKQSEATGFWTANSSSITQIWLKMARARCITRDLKWGVNIPREGYHNKCFYVWFDAPIGYLSITANYTKHWEQWWKSKKEEHADKKPVELYQFMGKDNVPFHTIFFPGSQLASKEQWTMLKHINTTEYLNYENMKFSKSKSTGIFGSHLKETGIPIEIWRYYLLAIRPEGSDSQFQWEDFQDRNNSELLPNLGNFCNRVLKFVYTKNDKKIPLIDTKLLDEEDNTFLKDLWQKTNECLDLYEQVKLKAATNLAMRVSGMGNKFAQDAEVWTIKDDIPKRNNKLAILVTVIRLLGALLEPIMPTWSAKLYHILNLNRNQREQELFREIKESGGPNVFSNLVNSTTLAPQMNLPVSLFRTSEFYIYVHKSIFSLRIYFKFYKYNYKSKLRILLNKIL